jgi:hypothetical protein
MRSHRTLRGCHVAVVSLFIVAGSVCHAQSTDQVIANAQWTVRPVGQGVIVKSAHFTNLFGTDEDVFVVDADLNTPGVALRFVGATGTAKVVSSHAGTLSGTAAAVNGNWSSNGVPIQYTKIDGIVKAVTGANAQERGGIAIAAEGTVTCRVNPPAGWPSLSEPNVMASEIPLVVGGQPYVWTPVGAPDYAYYYTNRHPRTSVGITAANHVLMVVVDGRRTDSKGATYAEEAELLIALGATDATVLDGGGSSTCWGRGLGVVNIPSDGQERAVADAVVVTAPPLPPTGPDPILIESRPGGANYVWYSEGGVWADNGVSCTAPGVTPGIGQRYASTYRSVVGAKSALFRPMLTAPGQYEVFVAWGAGVNRRSPIMYTVQSAGGAPVYPVDQAATANTWVSLGTHTFAAGNAGYVEVSNSSVDVSGSMYAAAAKIVPVATASVAGWELY